MTKSELYDSKRMENNLRICFDLSDFVINLRREYLKFKNPDLSDEELNGIVSQEIIDSKNREWQKYQKMRGIF